MPPWTSMERVVLSGKRFPGKNETIAIRVNQYQSIDNLSDVHQLAVGTDTDNFRRCDDNKGEVQTEQYE